MISAEQAKKMLKDKIKNDDGVRKLMLISFKKLLDANVKLAVKQKRNRFNLSLTDEDLKYYDDMSKIVLDAGYDIADLIESEKEEYLTDGIQKYMVLEF